MIYVVFWCFPLQAQLRVLGPAAAGVADGLSGEVTKHNAA